MSVLFLLMDSVYIFLPAPQYAFIWILTAISPIPLLSCQRGTNQKKYIGKGKSDPGPLLLDLSWAPLPRCCWWGIVYSLSSTFTPLPLGWLPSSCVLLFHLASDSATFTTLSSSVSLLCWVCTLTCHPLLYEARSEWFSVPVLNLSPLRQHLDVALCGSLCSSQ